MKLLLIEDDLEISKALTTFLKSNHYIVDTANNGELGLYLALTNNYDLIITDYLLPKINGDLVIKTLRQNNILTPILVSSICRTLTTKITALEDGADDYLNKPFLISELHARIKSLLRRKSPEDRKISIFQDLIINETNHEIQRAGQSIYLTTKEFSLLQLLTESPGFVYSKEIITERIWDEASCHLSNTIEAHILHLRKKIDFKKPFLIKTVPGYGYKLNLDP